MGMTSSTNAILDSKNTHFRVMHCPVFIHGHWYLSKPKNSWQMDVQPPKTSKCIDYVMILNVCDSILESQIVFVHWPHAHDGAHSSKRLRMDPLAADELVS